MKGRRAIVVPTAITIALLLFGLITAQLTRVVTSQGNTSHLDQRNRAFYLAVAGVSYGVSLIMEEVGNEVYNVDNPYVVTQPDGSRFEVYFEDAGGNALAVRGSGFTQKGVSAQAGRLLQRNPSLGMLAALWPGGGAGIDSVFVKTSDSSGATNWRLLEPVRDDATSPIVALQSLLTTGTTIYGYAPPGGGHGPQLWWYDLRGSDWEFIDISSEADRIVTNGEHLAIFGNDQSLSLFTIDPDDGTPASTGSPGLPYNLEPDLTATSVAIDPNSNLYLSYIDPGPPVKEKIARYDIELAGWTGYADPDPDLFNIRELSVGLGPDGQVVTYLLGNLEDGSKVGLWTDFDDDDDEWQYLGQEEVDQVTSDPEGRVFTVDQRPGNDHYGGTNINPDLGDLLDVPNIPARFWKYNDEGRLVTDRLEGSVPDVGSLVGGTDVAAQAFSSVADF